MSSGFTSSMCTTRPSRTPAASQEISAAEADLGLVPEELALPVGPVPLALPCAALPPATCPADVPRDDLPSHGCGLLRAVEGWAWVPGCAQELRSPGPRAV